MSLVRQARYVGNGLQPYANLAQDLGYQLAPYAKKQAMQLFRQLTGRQMVKSKPDVFKKLRKVVAKKAIKKVIGKRKRQGTNKGKTRVGKKRVKVSKAFRAKVHNAMEDEDFHGKFVNIKAGGIYTADAKPNAALFYDGQGNTPSINILGSPLQILNIASYLWNQKAYTPTWTTTTGNFPQNEFKCHVTSNRHDLLLRNNTQRYMHVTLYECVAKSNQTNAPLQDVQEILVGDAWSAATPSANRNNVILTTGTLGYYTALAGASTVGDASTFRPEFLTTWNTMWKHTQRSFTLKPGQGKNLTVKIADLIYDASKYTDGDGTIYRYMKNMTKAYFFRIVPEVSEINAGTTTGYQPFGVGAPHLLLTKKMSMHLKMPKHTSDIDPAALGGPIIASNKQNVYAFHSEFDLSSTPAATTRFDFKQPATSEGTAYALTIPA